MPQATIPLPKVSFGKRKKRSQMCEIFTDDGRIIGVELDVLRGCVDDPDRNAAFLLDSDNQFVCEDGHWYQIIGEHSTMPIRMINKGQEQDLNKLIPQIFRETHETSKLQQYENAMKNAWMEKILWIVAIPCITLLLFYALKMLGD